MSGMRSCRHVTSPNVRFWDRPLSIGATESGRVLPLGSADVNVRSGIPTAESRSSPFGQLWSFESTVPSVQSTTLCPLSA
jgi:hypothetical protein